MATINHTEYDPELWNWCPDPFKYTELKLEGKSIYDEMEEEIKEVLGHLPYANNEFSRIDVAVIMAILKRRFQC